MRRNDYSRDETERVDFGDAFGLSVPQISAPKISAPTISRPIPSVTPPSVSTAPRPTSAAGAMAAGITDPGSGQAVNRAVLTGSMKNALPNLLAGIAANATGRPIPTMQGAQVSFAPITPTQKIVTTGTGNTLANIIAATAAQAAGVPQPTMQGAQVSFAPVVPAKTATVTRASPGNIPTAAPAPTPNPVAPKTLPTADQVSKNLRPRGKPAQFVPGVQQIISQPAPRVARGAASAPITTQVQAPTGGVVTALWDVTNGGQIVRNPTAVDKTNPQWLVYSTGQVIRLG